mgnify:CR=1 FL=1
MIYADHAATTKMSAEAMAAMVKGWEVYGNPSSLHTIGQEAAVVLQKAREQIAVCLDADPKEIYFTSGGSEADNQALRSAAAIGKRKGHMHIISTAFEHHAILHTLEQLKADHKVVITLEDGILDGGFGEKIARFYGDSDMKVLNYGLKKEFLDRYDVEEVLKDNRLDAEMIAEDVKGLL